VCSYCCVVDILLTLLLIVLRVSAVEVLDGDNAYNCEKCKAKRKCIKRLTIYKYPKILVSRANKPFWVGLGWVVVL
jgi:ubiquitin C-terminal hydrolase